MFNYIWRVRGRGENLILVLWNKGEKFMLLYDYINKEK